jgi:hypothetical protein
MEKVDSFAFQLWADKLIMYKKSMIIFAFMAQCGFCAG